MLLWPREGAKKRAVIPCANAPGDQFPTPGKTGKKERSGERTWQFFHGRASSRDGKQNKRPSHPTSQARADAPPHAHKCAWGGRGICAADAGQRQRLREPEASAGSSAAMYTDAFPRMPSGLFGSKATLYPCAARGLSTPRRLLVRLPADTTTPRGDGNAPPDH